MDQQHTTSEITFHHHVPGPENVKRIWKIFWVLLIITVIELGLGLFLYATDFEHWLDLAIKGVIVILSLAKAFYIVSIFMHLGDEIRNMIMSIVVPLMLFIWFIAAFLWDGNSYKNLRNKYDKHFEERTTEKKSSGGH
jgi:cytochrome c oxidase subunit IV